MLDVNKIHFILASVPDKRALVEEIYRAVEENREPHNLLPAAAYWEKLGKPNRFDPAEVIFCKRMLQRELPEKLRQELADDLFRRHVTADEAGFSRELYMTIEQIRTLKRHGMTIGSHGYNHDWLNALAPQAQEREVDQALDCLRLVNPPGEPWIMCYPYGAYDDSLLSILKSRNCAAGLTTRVGIANVPTGEPLALPRLDTNDLPKAPGADASEWTRAAIGGVRSAP